MTDVGAVVHGDDFTLAGTEVELRKVEEKMREWKACRDQREIEILCRTLGWMDDGLEYEADEKHQQTSLRGP